MSDAEIVAETTKAFGMVDTYWRNLFIQWEVEWWTPDRFHEDGFYDSARGFYAACDGDFDTAFNAFFCGSRITGRGVVAWDMEFLRAESEIGNAPIYHTVSHEIGHAAQARFWHDDEGGGSHAAPRLLRRTRSRPTACPVPAWAGPSGRTTSSLRRAT